MVITLLGLNIARIRAIVNGEAIKYDFCKDSKGVVFTIIFDKLWETMEARGITQYKLIKDYHISNGQLDRLRKNSHVSTYTLDRLCRILHCRLEDIAQFVDEDGTGPL